jgi:ribosome biogenesis protein Nip4
MNDSINFRQINEAEKKIIINTLSNISSKILTSLYNLEKNLFISTYILPTEDNFPNIYLISNDQLKIVDTINNKPRICSVGLYFGFIKKGVFYLSLEGAEYLNKHDIFSEFQTLQVNEKAEKSILYGNNILKSMIIKIPINLKEREFLLIFNKLNEIIAIAQSRVKYQNIQILAQKEIVAMNLSDKGYYLRKKQ